MIIKRDNRIFPVVYVIAVIVLTGGCEVSAEPTRQAQKNNSPDERPHVQKHQVSIAGNKAWVSASSVLKEGSGRYAVTNAFDGNKKTAWVEGVEGDGLGSTLTVEFEKKVTLEGFVIRPGYVKSEKVFTENAAPRRVLIEGEDGTIGRYTLGYDIEFKYDLKKKLEGFYHTGKTINLNSVRAVIFKNPVETRMLRLTVEKVLTGSRYSDLAITEFEPLIHNEMSELVESDVVSLLAGLRKYNDFDKYLSLNADVEDLRNKYISSDPFEMWIYEDNPPVDKSMSEFLEKPNYDFPYFSRIEKEKRRKGNSAVDRFISYTQTSFIDAALVIDRVGDRRRIIGSPSFIYGDSEWIELYPVIGVDKSYYVDSLVEMPRRGGAPGAKHVVPKAVLEQ